MELVPGILADSDGDVVNIVVIILLVVLGLIGSVIKKAAKAKQDRQTEQRESARRDREALQEALRQKTQSAQQGRQARTAEAKRQAAAPSAGRRAAAPPPVPLPKRTRRREGLGEGVDEEMAEFARHQQAEEAGRQHRLHAAEPVSAPAESQPTALTAPMTGRPALRLQGPAVQQAIIYHEIFSPPKALRGESEMWDT
jgi:FtsZ-interacting cell division protein ZipA